MGTVLIGGLMSSLVLTLALVPVIYVFIMGLADRRGRRKIATTLGDERALPEFERTPAGAGAQGA
jgi:hypothetical protein